ncbi:hypothetical protein Cthiooxydans_46880 [Comamonas thiooxydans]|nr:hypothetical protein Cthiooxydans_46880 [Comamonas thiooxydans]
MTAYVVLEAIKNGQVSWKDVVTVQEDDLRVVADDEARMYLTVGQRVQLKDLVSGLIVASANDAANVLARHLAGSTTSFSALMNKTAQNLGMTNSHFITPSGISVPGHYSTAKDLSILAQRLTAEHPEYYKFSSQKEFSFRGFSKTSKNKLLGMGIGVDGLKTGHTIAAGWCIVATAQRQVPSEKSTRRVFAVLLGEPTAHQRISDAKELLDFGFKSLK